MYEQKLPWVVNYDENEIPPYELPSLLTCQDGTVVKTAEEWNSKRKKELHQLFRDIMYGNPLPMPDKVRYTVISEKKDARNGLATRREVRIDFLMNNSLRHSVIVLMYIPNERKGKVPVCVSLTFGGNQGITDEDDVFMTGLTGKRHISFIPPHAHTRRYPIDYIMKRGYALAVASYHDFFPDFREDGWQGSVYALFRDKEEFKTKPKDASAIAAWAWGYSRILDCVSTMEEIDGENAVCVGHSRIGKTSLWAGVEDERFKVVCVNDSGCGGAALSRRLYGETIYSMYNYHGIGQYWFSDKMENYVEKLQELPFDQHCLIALVAPRTVAVHSATEDQWADPKSEYMATFLAGEVYKLFGKKVLENPESPAPNVGVGTDVSYFLREGAHDILLSDWEQYLNAADHTFGK